MSVYHGSSYSFQVAKPFETSRSHTENGKYILDYKGISLHATPYKWIALAYTYTGVSYIHKGNKKKFNVGIPIRTKNDGFNRKRITIFGKKSLEYSLTKLYGKGGYLYTFNKNKFIWVEGLGMNEVISYNEQIPTKIEFIKDPVKQMKKEGVQFVFIECSK